MKLIVGLGNPGPRYALTRHNIGFMLVDVLAAEYSAGQSWKSEFKAETIKTRIGPTPVILCKPQTFMNLSGESVQPIVNMYKIDLENILVIHDEVDVPFGDIRFQSKRGSGGHNGIKSIHQMLGSDAYCRMRIGVDRPDKFVDDNNQVTRPAMEVHDYVLQKFSDSELKDLQNELFSSFVEAVDIWVEEGLQEASTRFNRPRKDREK